MLNPRGLFIIFLFLPPLFSLSSLIFTTSFLFFPQLFFCIKTFVSAIIKEDSHFCNLSGWLL
jgi:hypothetical protein